ncbi:MAG: efflux RND transporter periplasmic adaptor subunit [Kiritimatiellae bacterium]|nr:efflux RND transporter periplasmic adaptor subunit [Kiritimatiellia bacterium]
MTNSLMPPRTLFLLCGLTLPMCALHAEAEHTHGPNCAHTPPPQVECHDHEHDHEAHAHEAHEAHPPACDGHDHDHEAHAHEAHEAHPPACDDHDHDHETHAHEAPQPACEGHDHDHETHAHETPQPACEGHDHEHETHGGAPHAPLQSISVPLATQTIMGLKTLKVEPRDIQRIQRFIGRYELCPEARQIVAAPIAGLLKLEVATLTHVKQGDLLATITSPERKARAAELAVLEKRLETYRTLQQANAALETEIAIKRAEYQAQLLGAEEKDGVIALRAPADGWVESLSAISGAWVEPGVSLLQLANPKALRVKSMIPAEEARTLQEGETVHVDGHHGTLHLGIGESNGLVPVYTCFEHPLEHALAGARTTVLCTAAPTDHAPLAVPLKSIITTGVQPAVFVRDAHDATRFFLIPVTPGQTQGEWCAVAGLP